MIVLNRSEISMVLEPRDRIAAVESSRRELALTERRDVSARIKSRSLAKRRGRRAHTHRREVLGRSDCAIAAGAKTGPGRKRLTGRASPRGRGLRFAVVVSVAIARFG